MIAGELTLRIGRGEDAAAIARVAGRDSTSPPEHQVLVAEVDGSILAWIELATGRSAADPFHRTAHLVRLLELRACQLRPQRPAAIRAVARLVARATANPA
jgi:hypothetical protein